MTSSKLTICVIYGSARESRFGDVIGAWLLGHLSQRTDVLIETVDPQELDISLRHDTTTPTAIKLREVLARADGFIVMVPEYNRS